MNEGAYGCGIKYTIQEQSLGERRKTRELPLKKQILMFID